MKQYVSVLMGAYKHIIWLHPPYVSKTNIRPHNIVRLIALFDMCVSIRTKPSTPSQSQSPSPPYLNFHPPLTFLSGGCILFLKYSAKAELVLIVSTGMAESKKHASCPWPGRCKSTDRTLSTPTVWSILARSMCGEMRRDEGRRREGR